MAGQSVPAARSRLRAVRSDSISRKMDLTTRLIEVYLLVLLPDDSPTFAPKCAGTGNATRQDFPGLHECIGWVHEFGLSYEASTGCKRSARSIGVGRSGGGGASASILRAGTVRGG